MIDKKNNYLRRKLTKKDFFFALAESWQFYSLLNECFLFWRTFRFCNLMSFFCSLRKLTFLQDFWCFLFFRKLTFYKVFLFLKKVDIVQGFYVFGSLGSWDFIMLKCFLFFRNWTFYNYLMFFCSIGSWWCFCWVQGWGWHDRRSPPEEFDGCQEGWRINIFLFILIHFFVTKKLFHHFWPLDMQERFYYTFHHWNKLHVGIWISMPSKNLITRLDPIDLKI